MTIKWVKTDPLVMNGEPFCYGSRLTVRQLLQERRNGANVTALIKDHPELRTMGIAAAYAYAAAHRDRYGEFFEPAAGASEAEQGSQTRKVAPRPGSLSTAIAPPLCCTMP